MAYSYVLYNGDGATTNYAFSFPYIEASHIKVRVDGTLTSYTFLNSSTVTISPAPANGAVIEIRRETPKDAAPVDFADGSVLLERDLDLLAQFNLYTAQEAADGVAQSITQNSLGQWDAQSRRIINVADPVNAQDAVSKTWAETGMSSQLASATAQATAAAGSATSASSSATSASNSAATATTKASEASASATSAASSATAASGSATSAAGSATAAAASASAASGSATAAAASAADADSDAATALTAATNAGNSASSASTSATNAAGSATNAANSATAAANSATNAASSASSASTSASAAATSATNAANSASSAATQATNASVSASSAATSATNSANSATASANSAAAALVSENNAAASAVSAASSAASAAAALDNFDDRYLGAKASDPALDNDGNALITGALYFNTTDGVMKIYTSSGWIAASSASVATLATYEFVATGGQTVFTGTDAEGQTLSYVAPALVVTLNGVRLRPGQDYTATNGTEIVLVSAAAAGDELVVDAFGSFLVADTYSKAQTDALIAGIPVPSLASLGIENHDDITVDSTGRVGIGTGSPSYKLHVVGSNLYLTSSGNTELMTTNTTGTVTGGIQALSNQSIRVGSITNWPTEFVVNNTPHASLDSSGTFRFNSGYGAVATAYGCRAWVNFNGTGTVSINGSGNVSSITDHGTGNYTVNFANAMPDANYAYAANRNYRGGTNSDTGGYLSTNFIRVLTWETNGSLADVAFATVMVFR